MPFTYEDIQDNLIDLVTKLYLSHDCEAGGPLHDVLDDYNVCDGDIMWCLCNGFDKSEYEEYSVEVKKLCYQIGGLLLMIPEEERLELVSNAWVYANDTLIKEKNKEDGLE